MSNNNTQAALLEALPPLPSVPFARVRDLMSTSMAMTLRQKPGGPLYTGDQMRAYGEACARAAPQPAEAAPKQEAPASRAAIIQALVALDNATDAQSNPQRCDFPTIHDFGQMRRAADALRAALSAQPQQPAPEPVPPALWVNRANIESDRRNGINGVHVGSIRQTEYHETPVFFAAPQPPEAKTP